MPDFQRHPIKESIVIEAPLDRCFALSTRVELVKRTLGMNIVAPYREGEIDRGHVVAGSRVHWRGLKFGLPTHHHTLITGYAAPYNTVLQGKPVRSAFFQDSQDRGRFAFFQHDHYFTQELPDGPTVLHDEVRFALPFGPFGRMAARWMLGPHIRKLARKRFAMIRDLAQADGWREWVDSDGR